MLLDFLSFSFFRRFYSLHRRGKSGTINIICLKS